jgi:hypothetical protein
MTKNPNNFLTFAITFILFLKTAKKFNKNQKNEPSLFPKKQRELIKPTGL